MSPLPLLSPDPPSPSLCPPCAARVLDTWGRACFVQFLDTRGQVYEHSGTGSSATPSPFTPHLPHLPQFPPSPTQPLRLPPLRGTPYHFFCFLCSFSTVLVAMLFSRTACCALSHTHIAPRKIVLTAPFFSLVLDVAICSPSLRSFLFACFRCRNMLAFSSALRLRISLRTPPRGHFPSQFTPRPSFLFRLF